MRRWLRYLLAWVPLLLGSAYLGLALRNNCQAIVPGNGPGPLPAARARGGPCSNRPTFYGGLAATAPERARRVEAALLSQLARTALLGRSQAAGTGRSGRPWRRSERQRGKVLLLESGAAPAEEGPLVSLTVLEPCSRRVLGASYVMASSAPPRVLAATLRADLSLQTPPPGPGLALGAFALEEGLPRSLLTIVQAELRRRIVQFGRFSWSEPQLPIGPARNELPPPRARGTQAVVYATVGGTPTALWVSAEVRGPLGDEPRATFVARGKPWRVLFEGFTDFLTTSLPGAGGAIARPQSGDRP